MKKNIIRTGIVVLLTVMLCSCNNRQSIRQFYTGQTESFVELQDPCQTGDATIDERLTLNTADLKQEIIGFGACFNELGWSSLGKLSESDRQSIMKELFEPDTGANFTVCRMPIGANDFSFDWYSYDETDRDFELKDFSIEHDQKSLIPFIHAAQQYNPNIRIWASPWSPPTWMKKNRHYAMRQSYPGTPQQYCNGLQAWQTGPEGTDQFILEEEYLKSYANYFGKFIDAYRENGIEIFGVMPQNEFNSDQVFPSCCWTAKGLTKFVGDYLGPQMSDRGVDVMFGTMERADWRLVDSVLQDPKASRYVKAVGFQWAGRDALAKVREHYPLLTLWQTEQECGDGKNDWAGLLHSWELLKHYFDNGVSVYDYWNISLDKGGISRWGWAQNSLIVVNPDDSTYRYTYEYYLMKHISHFVKPKARMLGASGSAKERSIAFLNADNSVVVLYAQTRATGSKLQIEVNGNKYLVHAAPNTINTFVIR